MGDWTLSQGVDDLVLVGFMTHQQSIGVKASKIHLKV